MHGRAGRGGVIHGSVRTDDSVHRMHAVIAEAAADAGELEGSLQEGLAHGFTLLIPVLVAVVSLIVADGVESIPTAGVFREIHTYYINYLVFAYALMVKGAETVTLMQAKEVHGPGVHVRQLEYEQGRGARGYHIVPEGILDGDVGVFADGIHLLSHVPDCKRVVALEDGGVDAVFLIYNVAQHRRKRVASIIRIHLVASTEFGDVELSVAGLGEVGYLISGHAQAREQLVEHLAGLHFAFLYGKRVGAEAEGPYYFFFLGGLFGLAGADCQRAEYEDSGFSHHNAKIVILREFY